MRKRWIPHFIAITGFLVFSVLGLGSAATTPPTPTGVALPAVPTVTPPALGDIGDAAAAAALGAAVDAAAAPIHAAIPGGMATPMVPAAPHPPMALVGNIGGAHVSRVPWAAHTFIPSKNYTVVGAIVVRSMDGGATILADLMERAIAMGGHDIKNVIITHSITPQGAHVTSAIAVAIRYTNQTLTVREERIFHHLPEHSVQQRYVQTPHDVRTPW